MMILAALATAGQRTQASFARGPLKMVPLGLPLSSLRTTAALSENLMRVPSLLRYSFACRTMTAYTTCFLISGLPRLTLAMTRSQTPAAEYLRWTVLWPTTVNILMIFAPELSHVATWHPKGMLLGILALIACMAIDLLIAQLAALPPLPPLATAALLSAGQARPSAAGCALSRRNALSC